MGRRFAMGCVALEITQRCNLDCTLCYLSDSAEAIKDLPLDEVFRRIDMIRAQYGADSDIQITGGDPTLRKREELVAIVRRCCQVGLRPSLFTNGILASRNLLRELSGAGLIDVAFHVDMTQQRKGYTSEVQLNVIRRDYIERTRGLPLSVFFNTTVFPGNFHEISKSWRFSCGTPIRYAWLRSNWPPIPAVAPSASAVRRSTRRRLPHRLRLAPTPASISIRWTSATRPATATP